MFVLKSLATLVATALIAPWQMVLKLKDNDYLNSAPNTIITPEFSRFVEKVRREGKVPGVSVGVVLPDGRAECGAWGNKTEDGDEMTIDTSYILASVSKAFLSSSMGILMDDFANGRNITSLPDGVHSFDWFTKIADLLPHDWELDNKWATEMANIRDVLSHVSGLPRHDYSYWRDDSLLQVVCRMRHLRSSFELRQQWSYNNQMYMLGSYIISKYAGMTYPRFAMERMFHRLNMTSTMFSESEASKD
ncbi:class-A beta-lactamase family protein, partial [Abortiporus biennis]